MSTIVVARVLVPAAKIDTWLDAPAQYGQWEIVLDFEIIQF